MSEPVYAPASAPAPLPTPTRHDREMAAQLHRLPVEIVHQVISDLGITALLRLLVLVPNAYLESCVHSHLSYARIFSDELDTVKAYVRLYMQYLPTCTDFGIGSDRDSIKLWTDASSSPELFLARVAAPLIKRLRDSIEHLTPVYGVDGSAALIERWDNNTGKIDASPAVLTSLFALAYAAHTTLRAKRTDQIARLMAIVRVSPQMLLPVWQQQSQEPRSRSAHAHELRRLRRSLVNVGTDTTGVRRDWFFGLSSFPYLPPDRYLRMFRRVLVRFPHREPQDRSLVAYRAPLRPKTKLLRPTYAYPELIVADIDLCVRETLHGKINTGGYRFGDFRLNGNTDRESFVARLGKNRFGQPVFNKNLGPIEHRQTPYEDIEIAWLEAFVRVCRYMLDEMTHVMWNWEDEEQEEREKRKKQGNRTGLSCSEYWRRKIENGLMAEQPERNWEEPFLTAADKKEMEVEIRVDVKGKGRAID